MNFSESTDDLSWSDAKKRAYVWESLVKYAQESESNTFYYHIIVVKAGETEYDPVLLSRSEHKTILKDFEYEEKIRIIPDETEYDLGEEPHPDVLQIQLKDGQKKRRSAYSKVIKSLSDLIKDIKLRAEVENLLTMCFGVHNTREIRENQDVEIDVKEDQDELLLLLEELGFAEIKWESLKQQTHRMIGNRYIRVYFKGGSAKKFADALYGRSSIIRPKALEQIAVLVKDHMTHNDINEFFVQVGVPYALLLGNQQSKRETVQNVLLALSSTGEKEDVELLYKILEELSHPLTFQGDTRASVDFQYKITKVIRYDGLSLLGGKIHKFNDNDELQMTELEKNELELSAELSQAFSGIFGGNPFKGTTEEPKKNTVKEAAEKKEGATQTHIHIYNQNQNTQSFTAPETNPSEKNPSTIKEEKQGLAPNLKWEQIEIKFENGHDVTIRYADEEKSSNYKEMGFEDSKKLMPNTQWLILKHMAEHERFISFDDATQYTKELKSQKKSLSDKLQAYFGINDDPFEYIKSEAGSGYLALFELKPEKGARKEYLGNIE